MSIESDARRKAKKAEYDKVYRATHASAIAERKARHYQEHRIEHDEISKTWAKENRERRLEIQRRSQAKHKSKTYAAIKAWQRRNKDRFRALVQARRARLMNAPGNGVTEKDWQNILDRYGRKCLVCGSDKDLTLDHVIPLSAGGTHDPSNAQPLCRSCNSQKGIRAIDYRPA